MKKNDKKVTNKRKAPVRGIDPLRAGAAKGVKDYVSDLPEMSVEKISKLCWILQRGINQDAQAQLEEIVRRCNQFIPQVMRYMRLLDQLDREVIQPEIAAKKDSRKDARAQNGKIPGVGRVSEEMAKPNLCKTCTHFAKKGCEICGCADYEERRN